ncbi:MAG: DUF4260 domain-containing protein [Gammaproteobacteria bacterium]
MSGETTGTIRAILRLEGLCFLLLSITAYGKLGFGWSTFALFFLLPDLSLAGYLINASVGAISYNAAHSYIGAIACLICGYALSDAIFLNAGLIWCAHIGFDRALGFGLKYSAGFKFTHLGRIGRLARSAPIVHYETPR